ncbi:MAG: glycosyltransferase family 2 protein [Tannerellaceae bacterium]|jgi:glycosyltransferase involved in cell wall biosynthesis|nr:glycosyltransferase family 2 protein [Tannerellaceae bacterium]
MDNRIAILLSTYNSEKYLCEQIDSILNQSYKEWILYIRDDGSTDETLNIIKEYCSQHSNIVLCKSENKNRGAKNSFFWLLEHVDALYYMFCDHDDVWLPFKVEITYKKMKIAEQDNFDKSIIVNTDLMVVDNNLQIIHPSMWEAAHLLPDILKSSFHYLCICNFVTGCTMMINQKAKEVSFPVSSKAIFHDSWIALKVLYTGGIIIPIKEQTILYRQHTQNVCGVPIYPTNYILDKIKHCISILKMNKIAYEMCSSVGKTNIFVYCLYKIKYYFKRR